MGIYKISGKLTTQIDSVSDIQTTQIDDIIVEGRSWPQPVAAAEEDTGIASGGGRGLFAGGYTTATDNKIDYVTIATTGNAADFGDLTQARRYLGACSDGTKAVFGGGVSTTNIMDYVTIATLANAADFGDLTVARGQLAGCSGT